MKQPGAGEGAVTGLGWISCMGVPAPELEQLTHGAVNARIVAGNYRQADVDYIQRIKLSLVEGNLNVSDRQLENLRRLCQLAEVELIPARISSHRRFVGPLIVAGKKVLFSILKVLLKDTLRKQRDFNAAVITFLAQSTQLDKTPGSVHDGGVEQA